MFFGRRGRMSIFLGCLRSLRIIEVCLEIFSLLVLRKRFYWFRIELVRFLGYIDRGSFEKFSLLS